MNHQVNNVFLASRSDYFRVLLTQKFKTDSRKKIEVKSVWTQFWKEIDHYIMTGELSLNQYDLRYILKFLKEANYFLLDDLVDACVRTFMPEYLSDFTCIDLYLFSQKYFIETLKQLSLDFMMYRSGWLMDNEVFEHRWNLIIREDDKEELKKEIKQRESKYFINKH